MSVGEGVHFLSFFPLQPFYLWLFHDSFVMCGVDVEVYPDDGKKASGTRGISLNRMMSHDPLCSGLNCGRNVNSMVLVPACACDARVRLRDRDRDASIMIGIDQVVASQKGLAGSAGTDYYLVYRIRSSIECQVIQSGEPFHDKMLASKLSFLLNSIRDEHDAKRRHRRFHRPTGNATTRISPRNLLVYCPRRAHSRLEWRRDFRACGRPLSSSTPSRRKTSRHDSV